MERKYVRAGGLLFGFITLIANAGLPANVVKVQSRSVEIDYHVNEAAMPLQAVRIWYTEDGGQTWELHGLDEDRQAPAVFISPHEGLFGFYLVLVNAAGASGISPNPQTVVQQWVLVDFTPPVIQTHNATFSNFAGQNIVSINWTAVDSNFGARPIEVAYRRPADEKWYLISDELLANTGRFDWRVPAGISGTLGIRVTATDDGGHRVSADPLMVDVRSPTPLEIQQNSKSATTTESMEPPVSASVRARAVRLFNEALNHKERGEFREAIARLREVVKLNPEMTDAFAEMAALLYRVDDYDKALGAYEIVLKRQPIDRTALQGAAMTYAKKLNYPTAAERLRTILRHNPADAEVWMNLGDVAIYQGDEVLARECYTRAAQIDPKAERVIVDARRRLTLLSEVSRSYQPNAR